MAFFRFTASLLLLSLSIISLVPTLALPTLSSITSSIPIQTVYEFPVNNTLENIAVRRNGQLLVTLTKPAPRLYQIDPFRSHDPVLIYQFPDVSSALGITETTPDIFYVAIGTINPDFTGLGTYSVWKVDLTAFSPSQPSKAVVTKTADFPDALLLNGMITLNASAGLLLISDSGLGLVWRLNVHTGQIIRAIQDPLMAYASPRPKNLPVGINGLKIRDGSLFFQNYDRAFLARIPIRKDGTASGAGVIVATNITSPDDFQFDVFGDAFVAQNTPANALGFVKNGQDRVRELASIPGTTACQFGRTLADSTSLYVTFSGNSTVGGGVVRAEVGVPGP